MEKHYYSLLRTSITNSGSKVRNTNTLYTQLQDHYQTAITISYIVNFTFCHTGMIN